ncbi:MAG: transcription antitermination factor NusB [Planctomycetes bacterium]|nr:transcription antitermination factor NusB [Planctomycetota bacterium]
MRKRSLARELALQCCYSLDCRGKGAAPVEEFLAEQSRDKAVVDYARILVDGVVADRGAIDAEIRKVAENWDVGRMAVVDRNILRIAVYEILHRDDVPPVAAINEAIELAKRYGSASSGAFVNGILDRIRLSHGRAGSREAGGKG